MYGIGRLGIRKIGTVCRTIRAIVMGGLDRMTQCETYKIGGSGIIGGTGVTGVTGDKGDRGFGG